MAAELRFVEVDLNFPIPCADQFDEADVGQQQKLFAQILSRPPKLVLPGGWRCDHQRRHVPDDFLANHFRRVGVRGRKVLDSLHRGSHDLQP